MHSLNIEKQRGFFCLSLLKKKYWKNLDFFEEKKVIFWDFWDFWIFLTILKTNNFWGFYGFFYLNFYSLDILDFSDFLIFDFFLKLLRSFLKVIKVTTRHQKWPKMGTCTWTRIYTCFFTFTFTCTCSCEHFITNKTQSSSASKFGI